MKRYVHLKDDRFEAIVDLHAIKYIRRTGEYSSAAGTDELFFASIGEGSLVFGTGWSDALGSSDLGLQLWDAYKKWTEQEWE